MAMIGLLGVGEAERVVVVVVVDVCDVVSVVGGEVGLGEEVGCVD